METKHETWDQRKMKKPEVLRGEQWLVPLHGEVIKFNGMPIARWLPTNKYLQTVIMVHR